MSEPRFLVVRLGSLGDIVHTFPAVAGLRQSFPPAEIIWLTHPRWVNLVASSGLASEIWPVDSRDLASVRQTITRIRAQNWTASIDYQGLWKSALLPFLARIPKRIGFSSETIREVGVPILYTDRVHPHSAHIADQNGELSLRAGAQNAVGPVRLRVDESDCLRVKSVLAAAGINQYIVLSPGGGWRSKCWPAERFGELCQKIRHELNLPCVINYGPGEEPLAAAVKSVAANADPFLYDGELGPLMALLHGARCIVGGDTGPLHLAVALGTKPVAIFGPTNPARNGPYPQQPFVLRDPAASTTHKRETETHPSLLKISVVQVFDAVKLQLGASA
ncbi:MAG TPA: glycosyltransferase family 9 protein [Candidatus Acidoferrum sp.]|nr:glycosyltransferase family 9 protein [Candidatus Acidoferrum sp.]